MPNTVSGQHNRYEQILVRVNRVPREEPSVLAMVPTSTHIEGYSREGLRPASYRQALLAMLTTPEIESHMNYVTASFIVAIFGGWLASKLIVSRTFTFIIDIMLFIASLALAGLLIGFMLGLVILPAETIPVLLGAMVVMLLVFGVVLVITIVTAMSNWRTPQDDLSSRNIKVVYSQEQRQWRTTTNTKGR